MNTYTSFRKCFLRCLLLLLALPAGLKAQQVTIKGKVTDQQSGIPLIGVSVVSKGTSQGAVTDENGQYALQVSGVEGTLVFSFIGYDKKEVPVNKRTRVDVSLTANTENLNAVEVIGYGTQKKADITGAVVSLDEKRLKDLPNTNILQGIEGAVPGVTISQNSAGAEENGASIIIRGQNSITASTTPLIVLDGVPYNGNISDINPADIASINILKDASAAAIYGSRGSNGVMLITTKKGSTGKPVISYDGFYGVEQVAHMPTYLSPQQFYQFKQTRVPGSITLSEQKVYDSKKFPDWPSLVTQDGRREQHTLGIRGGSEKVKYYISATYLDVKGVAVNDQFKRASTRINLDIAITDWLSWGTNTQISYTNRDGLAAYFDDAQNGAYAFDPLTTAYDSTGALTIYPFPENVGYANPLSPTLAKNNDENYEVFSNDYFLVQFPFLKGLSYRLNTGIEYNALDQSTYYGRDTKLGLEAAGQLSLNNALTRNYTVENILAFDRSFGRHKIDFTGLYSYEYDNSTANSLLAKGFPNDVLTYYQANIALSIQPNATYSKTTLLSQMARINYSYNDKYLLTLTGRRDGFSGFGADKKFGFFPSVAVGWNIISEKFMTNVKALSNLKLRLSYGSNGNQAIGAYQTLAKLTSRPYVDGTTNAPGYIPTSLANPDLGWETTNTANIGLDFGFWGGRLQGTLDAYHSNTHNLLLKREISPVEGVTSILENIGKTSNKGIELGLTSVNIKDRNFTWTTSGNISLNRNKIVELYGNGENDTLNNWFIGHPINVNFGYVYNGVWQTTDDLSKSPQPNTQPGYAKVKDLNGDGVIDGKDRTIIGSLQPSFIWGLANTFKYKNFSLYVFVHGVEGTSRPNTLLAEDVNSDVSHNTTLKNWWTPSNPTNDYYANNIYANIYGVQLYQSDAYIRVEDISLSYDLAHPVLQRWGLGSLRFYIDLRNMFTITKWTGLDPELSNQAGIPLQKEYLIGMDISL